MAGSKGGESRIAVLSKKGRRKQNDPMTLKNKFKSMVFGANYLTKWSVFAELQISGELFYFRANGPDEDTLDIKVMDVERKTKNCRTAMEVHESFPCLRP